MRSRIAFLLFCCLLLATPASAQTDAEKELADVLNKYLRIADSSVPKTGGNCYALVRPARTALFDFKSHHGKEFEEILKSLENADSIYDRGCEALNTRGTIPLWAAANEHVYLAEQLFYALVEESKPKQAPATAEPQKPAPTPTVEKSQPPPAQAAPSKEPEAEKKQASSAPPAAAPNSAAPVTSPPAPAETGKSQATPSPPQEAKPTEKQPPTSPPPASAEPQGTSSTPAGTETKKAAEPPPTASGPEKQPPQAPEGPKGDPKVVERAQDVIALVQKMDSALDLALGKDVVQNLLIEAHAALQELANSKESEDIPLTVGTLRLVIAYSRRNLSADDSFARSSAKEALQKARNYLTNYQNYGQEMPPH